jgi:hypothetical protein
MFEVIGFAYILSAAVCGNCDGGGEYHTILQILFIRKVF